MQNNAHTTIYIEENEEITSIVERIKRTPASEIALVVPLRSFLAQSIVNLKILKKYSDNTGKQLMIVTRDNLCRSLAEKVGLLTGRKLDSETLDKTQVDTLTAESSQSQLEKPGVGIENVSNLNQPADKFQQRDDADVPAERDFPASPSLSLLKDEKASLDEMNRATSQATLQEAPQPMRMGKQPGRPRRIGEPVRRVEEVRSNAHQAVALRSKERSRPKNAEALASQVQPKKMVDMSEVRPLVSIDGAVPLENKGPVRKDLGTRYPQTNFTEKTKSGIKEPTGIIKENLLTKFKNQNQATAKKSAELKQKLNSKLKTVKKSLKGLKKTIGRSFSKFPAKFKATKKLSFRAGGRGSGSRRKKNNQKNSLLPQVNTWILWIFGLLILGTIFWVLAFTLPKAEVEITPKTEITVADFTAQALLEQTELDLEHKALPASQVQETVSFTEEFDATGEPGEVSADVDGTLIIYNEYSASFEVLVEGTRLLAPNGTVLKTVEAVRLPGFEKQDGEIIPGQAAVGFVVDKKADGELSANDKLTIPGLEGDESYDKIYGTIETGLSVENNGAKQVTAQDIVSAKQNVEDNLEAKIMESLEAKNSDQVIIKASLAPGRISWDVNKEVNQETNKFKLRVEVPVSALAYSRQDLEKVAEAMIKEVSGNKGEFTGELKMNVTEGNFIENRGLINLDVSAQKSQVIKINEEEIISNILGLSNKEAEEQLKNFSGVEEVKVKGWPFWVRSVPDNEKRVKIKLIY